MGETLCPIDRTPIPPRPGPGRPRVYCSPRCRRMAERRAAAARTWAMADPTLKAMVATDLQVVDLDVDEVNRALDRGR